MLTSSVPVAEKLNDNYPFNEAFAEAVGEEGGGLGRRQFGAGKAMAQQGGMRG